MKRSFSYRLWKHLNKRMVRYSQTKKKRILDPVRYRIWKYFSEKILTDSNQLESYRQLDACLPWRYSDTLKQWRQFSIFKRTYDFVFPLGRSCHCSTTLRQMGIQKASYPFDWIVERGPAASHLGLNNKINLLSNNMTHMIDFSDLKEIVYPENKAHRSVLNNRTGLLYLHEFPWDKTIEEHYPAFKEKYDRRTNRLLKRIEISKNILMVWIHGLWDQIDLPEEQLNPDEIKQSMALLKKAFPDKNIDVLCLNHDPSVGDDIIINETSPHISFVRSNHTLFDQSEAHLEQPIPLPIKKILSSLNIKKSPTEK